MEESLTVHFDIYTRLVNEANLLLCHLRQPLQIAIATSLRERMVPRDVVEVSEDDHSSF